MVERYMYTVLVVGTGHKKLIMNSAKVEVRRAKKEFRRAFKHTKIKYHKVYDNPNLNPIPWH